MRCHFEAIDNGGKTTDIQRTQSSPKAPCATVS